MAPKSSFLPLLFVVVVAGLLFSQVFARELQCESQFNDEKLGHHGGYCRRCRFHRCCTAEELAELAKKQGSDGNGFNDNKYHYGCRHMCGHRCCSAEEVAELAKKERSDGSGFNDNKYHYGCRHMCGHRCCSAEEFAEFKLTGKIPGN